MTEYATAIAIPVPEGVPLATLPGSRASRSMDAALGLSVAIICTDGVEEVELVEPRKALDDRGASTVLVSPKSDSVLAWRHDRASNLFPVDVSLDSAIPEAFDGLLIPGGVQNADALRLEKKAVAFVRSFFEAGRPVAVICHGPWMLVEADVVSGKRLTSWPSLQTDIRNAGGDWVDEPVVVSGNLLTSRKPDDIPAFNAQLIQLFGCDPDSL